MSNQTLKQFLDSKGKPCIGGGDTYRFLHHGVLAEGKVTLFSDGTLTMCIQPVHPERVGWKIEYEYFVSDKSFKPSIKVTQKSLF